MKFLFIIGLIFTTLMAAKAPCQWEQARTPSLVQVANCLTSDGPTLYAGIGSTFDTSPGPLNCVLRSIDNGESWTNLGAGILNSSVYTIAAQGSTLYAGTGALIYDLFTNPSTKSLWRSTDGGETWTQLKLLFGYEDLVSLAMHGNELFASTEEGLLRTDDSGTTWKVLTDSLYYPLVFVGSRIYAGSDFQALIVSSDSGTHWNEVPLPFGTNASDIIIKDSFIVSVIGAPNYFNYSLDTGVFLAYSSDNGKSWQENKVSASNPASQPIEENNFAFDGRKFYCATYTSVGTEWYSADTGKTWISMSSSPDGIGGPNLPYSLVVSRNNLVLGSTQEGLYYYPLANLAGAEDKTDGIDSISFFPNPTPGPIAIWDAAGVVVVTNVLGEPVLRAGSGNQEPNSGEITIDLSKLPAGTYFARIETPDGIVVKKIIKE